MSYHWIKIADNQAQFEESIPLNASLFYELKNEKICISRTAKGVFATQDRCPHNGASLSRGFCTKNNELVCALHRYSFDLQSGKSTSGGAYALKTYPIDYRNSGVYLGIKAKWWEL